MACSRNYKFTCCGLRVARAILKIRPRNPQPLHLTPTSYQQGGPPCPQCELARRGGRSAPTSDGSHGGLPYLASSLVCGSGFPAANSPIDGNTDRGWKAAPTIQATLSRFRSHAAAATVADLTDLRDYSVARCGVNFRSVRISEPSDP